MGKGQTGCWWPNLNSLRLNYPTQAALWEETAGRGEKLNVNCVIFLLHVFTPWNLWSGLFNSFKTCIPCSFTEVGSNKVTFLTYLYFTGVFFFFWRLFTLTVYICTQVLCTAYVGKTNWLLFRLKVFTRLKQRLKQIIFKVIHLLS